MVCIFIYRYVGVTVNILLSTTCLLVVLSIPLLCVCVLVMISTVQFFLKMLTSGEFILYLVRGNDKKECFSSLMLSIKHPYASGGKSNSEKIR